MAHHRQDYSPAQLLIVGARMTDRYEVEDAFEDYMRMHPDADPVAVRAELTAADVDPTPLDAEDRDL